MKQKRQLAEFILKEISNRGSGRDQRDIPYHPTKSDIVDILVKFEEEYEGEDALSESEVP